MDRIDPLVAQARKIADALLANDQKIKKEIPPQPNADQLLVQCKTEPHKQDQCASCGKAVVEVKHCLALRTLSSVGVDKPNWGQYQREFAKGGSSASHAVIPQTILSHRTKDLLNEYLIKKGACGKADADFWKQNFEDFWKIYKAGMAETCSRPVSMNQVERLVKGYEEDLKALAKFANQAPPKPPAEMDLELSPLLGQASLAVLLAEQLQVPMTTQAVQQVSIRPDDAEPVIVTVMVKEKAMEWVDRDKYIDDPNKKGAKIKDPSGAKERVQRPAKDGAMVDVPKQLKAFQAPKAVGHVPVQFDMTVAQTTTLGSLFGPGTKDVTITRKNPVQTLKIHCKLPDQPKGAEDSYVPTRTEHLLDVDGKLLMATGVKPNEAKAIRALNVVTDAYKTTLERTKEGTLVVRAYVKGRVPGSEAIYYWTLKDGEKEEMFKDTYVNNKILHRKYKISPAKLDRVDFTPEGEKVSYLPQLDQMSGELTRKVDYCQKETVLQSVTEPLPKRKELCAGVDRIFNNMENTGYFGSQCKLCEELQGDFTLLQRMSILAQMPKLPSAFVSDALLSEVTPGKAAKGSVKATVTDARIWMEKWMDSTLKEPLQQQLQNTFGQGLL
ncbi:MAG: hypothetical protein IT162_20765 [Bryobacterales bacterium]|nr:hypothetical protein [Bryobacterales bacterium]